MRAPGAAIHENRAAEPRLSQAETSKADARYSAAMGHSLCVSCEAGLFKQPKLQVRLARCLSGLLDLLKILVHET